MMFHIVTHCYASTLPHYAAMLRYHLSGFLLHPPSKGEVNVDVHCTGSDIRTMQVIEEFMPKMRVNGVLWDVGRLGRRCIGRNFSAKASAADWVVFTDVDYVWWGFALDSLLDFDVGDASLIYPGRISISKDHSTGDETWARGLIANTAVDIDPSEYIPKHYDRAIGGVQVVTGRFARRYGYLDGTGWQRPTDRPFSDFRDDVVFRRECAKIGPIKKVDLPDIFRIRHSTTSYQ